MVAVTITQARLVKFKYNPDGSKIQRLWDSTAGGLGAEVFKSGKRSWIFRYNIHGKQRFMTLGTVAELSIDDARDKAILLRGQVRAGNDPKVEANKPDGQTTFDELYDIYINTAYFKTRSYDYQVNLKSTYKKYLQDDLGYRPLDSIKRFEIREKIDGLIEKSMNGAARGLLSRARILFAFACEREYIEASPADHIKPKYTSSGERDTWLDSPDKIKAAWYFAGKVQVRAVVRWMLLTGCRRDEARMANWSQIKDDVWTVTDTKNGRELTLPVTPMMQDVLDEMKATFGATDWVFPSTVSNFKPIPRGSLSYLLSTYAEFTPHELRHTVETMMADLGVTEERRNLILNHASVSSGKRYNHAKQITVKGKALAVWHSEIFKIVNTCTA